MIGRVESSISGVRPKRTHKGGINPNAIMPDPNDAGRDIVADTCVDALRQFKTISGAAELNAIKVTAATSSGISYWSIKTSTATDHSI